MIKQFARSLLYGIKSTSNTNQAISKFYFATPVIYHSLDIESISDKWYVDFSYCSSSLTLADNKIRPYVFGRVFMIKLVEKAMRFVKGRPQYKIELSSSELAKLTFWSAHHGKFQIVRTNQYKQQVFTIEKIKKQKPSQVSQMFNNKDSPHAQKYPMDLYRFSFYVQIFLIIFIEQQNIVRQIENIFHDIIIFQFIPNDVSFKLIRHNVSISQIII